MKNNCKFVIGFVGAIIDLKGWRYILEAYNLLKNNYDNEIEIIIAGAGPQENIEDLKRVIKLNKIKNNVNFMGLVEDAGKNLMPFIDILILPSKSEGLPMTLIEAQGNGVPILATKVGGIPEILVDGYNGFLLKEMLLKDRK